VSYETVRDHLKSIYEKLHVHSRGEAVARFQETVESVEE
jgi:DNA-binding CsgD family transcriptional regulator